MGLVANGEQVRTAAHQATGPSLESLSPRIGGEARREGFRCRQRGQVVVLFAFMLAGLIGMLGLSIDLGFNFVQRRALQNAADAAVTVALNDIKASAPTGTPNNTDADVRKILAADDFPLGMSTSSSIVCEFLSNSGPYSPSQPCSANQVPLDASGARVSISETYHTFFMPVLGVTASAISASAAGHLEIPGIPADQIPFVVCGNQAATITGNGKSANGSFNIYAETTTAGINEGLPYETWPPTINSSLVGSGAMSPSPTFLLYASNAGSSFKGINDCSVGSNFKGAMGNNNGIISIPPNSASMVAGQGGMKTGPFQVRVPLGCNANWQTGCVAIVPVAEDPTAAPVKETSGMNQQACTGGSGNLCIDMWVAMSITQLDTNHYTGQMLQYQPTIQFDGTLGWTVGGSGQSSVTTARLTQ